MTKQKIFVDTGFWINIFLTNEPDHDKSAILFRQLRNEDHLIYTSNDVIDETVTRLIYKNQFTPARKFINFIKEACDKRFLVQLWTDEVLQVEAFKIAIKYFEHRLSLTDATSIALMHRFNLDTILTLDAGFKKSGIKALP